MINRPHYLRAHRTASVHTKLKERRKRRKERLRYQRALKVFPLLLKRALRGKSLLKQRTQVELLLLRRVTLPPLAKGKKEKPLKVPKRYLSQQLLSLT
jgi:hypothetical protein